MILPSPSHLFRDLAKNATFPPPGLSQGEETSPPAGETTTTLQSVKKIGTVGANKQSQDLLKTFPYRLYPTKRQARLLSEPLEA